jgi:6-pyruvoyltetrahydropterin/6-carboxytetrahydropterin synthase
MYKVCKTFKVPIGHRLSKHKGLCKNIHGHNLKLQIQLRCDGLDANDMVIDFGDLKTIVAELLGKYDHTTIFNITDKVNIDFFKSQGYRYEFISEDNQDPTAEVLSEYLYKLLELRFNLDNIYVDFVRVWENDNSYAEYME